jgi:hypothetical protein
LFRRRRARASLVDYSKSITIPGAPVSDDPDEWLFHPIETEVARHHVVTMQAIERCVRTDFGRLMIFEPPGSAKSTYASVVGPTWAMGAIPGLRVLMAGYASTPIVRHSKRARQIASSPEYQSIWERETAIVEGSKAADEWELTNGSGLFAAGLTAGITSSRCDLGLIDDPIAGREEADSDTMREKILAAYEDDFLTRLKPKASVILIQTRWHQDDLAGSILPEKYDGASGLIECRDGQTWEVLNLPARCERGDDPAGRQIGEYLWPEWFSEKHWSIYERNPRTWASLYQQRPAPQEGHYFKRDDIQRCSAYPQFMHVYMASDFAVRAKDCEATRGPDFTEHGVFGVDTIGDVWALGWWFGQTESDKSIDAALDLVKTHEPIKWFGESGVIESAIGPSIRSRMRQRNIFVARELLPSVVDKVARASAFAGRTGARTFHVPFTAWGDRLIDQLCSFPAGRYDDAVDVCGLVGRAIDQMHPASAPEPEKHRGWKEELLEMTGQGGRNPATA